VWSATLTQRTCFCHGAVSCLSVSLSRSVRVLCWNRLVAAQYGTIVIFFRTKHYGEIPTGFLCDGGRMQVRYEKIAIINQYIALSRNKCLQDRTAHSCHEKPTGTCLQFVELCHFLLPWLWKTNPNFKGRHYSKLDVSKRYEIETWNASRNLRPILSGVISNSWNCSLLQPVRKTSTLRQQGQKLSYRKQIARQLRTKYAEGIYDNPVTLKSRLTFTQNHWKPG